jgi:hypothetical protein
MKFYNSISITLQKEKRKEATLFIFLSNHLDENTNKIGKDRVTLLFITFYKVFNIFLIIYFLIKQLNLFFKFECTHKHTQIKNILSKYKNEERSHTKLSLFSF